MGSSGGKTEDYRSTFKRFDCVRQCRYLVFSEHFCRTQRTSSLNLGLDTEEGLLDIEVMNNLGEKMLISLEYFRIRRFDQLSL